MQKTLFTFLLLFITISGFAQKVQTIFQDTLRYREEYEVLKSNPKVKYGRDTLTILLGFSRKVLTTGFYRNNQKDSIWREYDVLHNLLAEGQYKEGKRIGVWTAYDKKQQAISKYDFDHDTLVYFLKNKDDSTHKYQVVNDQGDTILTTLDNPPFYVEGQAVMYRNIEDTFTIPHLALRNRADGTVVINVTIDEHGHIINYSVAKALGYGMEEETIKNIKLLPPDWMPAKLHGKNVTAVIQIPLHLQFRSM